MPRTARLGMHRWARLVETGSWLALTSALGCAAPGNAGESDDRPDSELTCPPQDACSEGCACPGVSSFGPSSEHIGMAASDGSRVFAVVIAPQSVELSLRVLDAGGQVIAEPPLRRRDVSQIEADGQGGFYVLGSSASPEFEGFWLDHWTDEHPGETLDIPTTLATRAEIEDFQRVADQPFLAVPRAGGHLAMGRAWDGHRFDVWQIAPGTTSPTESNLWVDTEELHGQLREFQAIDVRILDLIATDTRIQLLADVAETAAWPRRLVLVSQDTQGDAMDAASARVCNIGYHGGAMLLGLDTVAYLRDELVVDAGGCRGPAVRSLASERLDVLQHSGPLRSDLLALSARDDRLGVVHIHVGADHQGTAQSRWFLPGERVESLRQVVRLGSDSVLVLDHDAHLRKFDGSLREAAP